MHYRLGWEPLTLHPEWSQTPLGGRFNVHWGVAMDQSTTLQPHDRRRAADRLAEYIVQSIAAARAVEKPFYNLAFDHVFPDDIYAQILRLMPVTANYGPMHGRSKGLDLEDGTHTRIKIDLFPEYIRRPPPEKRALWNAVGRALCSYKVRQACMPRLAPRLKMRFGEGYAKVGMYPIPIFNRDIPGHLIPPHTTRFGRASLCSFTCRPMMPIPTSAPSSMMSCPTAPSRSTRRCALRPIPAMPSRSVRTPRTRPTRCIRA